MIHPDDLRDCMKLPEHDGNSDGVERGSGVVMSLEEWARLCSKNGKLPKPMPWQLELTKTLDDAEDVTIIPMVKKMIQYPRFFGMAVNQRLQFSEDGVNFKPITDDQAKEFHEWFRLAVRKKYLPPADGFRRQLVRKSRTTKKSFNR